MNAIPQRALGKTGVQVSALGLGGHHLGNVKTYEDAERIVHEAMDGGVTFFDNCWEYHNGKSELWLGRALASGNRRSKAFLMTKVCTHGRSGQLALQMLDESLRRLQTDHLDLWQIHGVSFDNDPRLAFAKGGVIEALDSAKRAGKVRFVGFTGHKDPAIHLEMLSHKYPFDTCQFPLNCFDASFRSFEQRVLPECARQGISVIGMKTMTGKGEPIKKNAVTAEEMLRYSMSLPIMTSLTGIDDIENLRKNLKVAQSFKPMSENEMQALRDRCRPVAADGRFELYKLSLKYDNPEARTNHGFSIDPTSTETKETLAHATGKDKAP